MTLSYSLRLACLAIVSVGLLQIIFEVLLWFSAPCMLRLLRFLSLRHRERALYSLQVLPSLFALLLTCFCWIPQYVSNETNLAPENVGWICLLCVAAVAIRVGRHVSSGIAMVAQTTRFSRALLRGNSPLGRLSERLPVITVAGTAPRIALVGLRRPFILISRSLMEDGGLDPLALDLVLEHERSHATQWDNWKLLSLRCLPKLPLRVSEGKTWVQLWRSTAERAADADAVQGSTKRALKLAETLVALARLHKAVHTELACTHFICAATDLASRVDGLTQSRPDTDVRPMTILAIGFAVLVFAIAIVLVSLAPVLADLPEHVLHLG
jgi:beta-lactamase regulating signal transducer with metallopeptidase domain